MSRKLRRIVSLILMNLTAVAAGGGLVCAETYHWTDSQGVMHFSDNPASVPQSKKGQGPAEGGHHHP